MKSPVSIQSRNHIDLISPLSRSFPHSPTSSDCPMNAHTQPVNHPTDPHPTNPPPNARPSPPPRHHTQPPSPPLAAPPPQTPNSQPYSPNAPRPRNPLLTSSNSATFPPAPNQPPWCSGSTPAPRTRKIENFPTEDKFLPSTPHPGGVACGVRPRFSIDAHRDGGGRGCFGDWVSAG